MKKIIYSPDYKAKIRKMRYNLDRQFGADIRQEIFKKINDRIHSIQDNEDIMWKMFRIRTTKRETEEYWKD